MEMIERPPAGRRKFLLRAVLACTALVGLAAFGVDKEELDCEQAVAHMVECCPDFDARTINCSRSGCGGTSSYSGIDLSYARSSCILGASCEVLRKSGACEQPKKVICD